MDLDNVHDVVLNISKFATMIFADLFNHKRKEKTMAIQEWSIWTEW
jgi:hypothetical protein